MKFVKVALGSNRYRVDLAAEPPAIDKWDPAGGWAPWAPEYDDKKGTEARIVATARAIAL